MEASDLVPGVVVAGRTGALVQVEKVISRGVNPPRDVRVRVVAELLDGQAVCERFVVSMARLAAMAVRVERPVAAGGVA